MTISIPFGRAVATAIAAGGVVTVLASSAAAATYEVGPGQQYQSLEQVRDLVGPGDVIELQGDAAYSGDLKLKKSGTAGAKITVRGVRKNGKRPVIRGGDQGIKVMGSHYVLEGLEITGSARSCLVHSGNDLTVRDTVVHDCPKHGILGTDTESGSLTLDHVEVYRAGSGLKYHSIYIATDEKAYPGSVFRMQHSYVHDVNGGNAVKSRAERNEIYYNWVESAEYHVLELIGSEEFPAGVVREDSDVVGNVLRKTGGGPAIRLGGDGSGDSFGRFRLVNNTVVLAPGASSVLRLFEGIESVEVTNNVFYQTGGAPIAKLMRSKEAKWSLGHAKISGRNNWIPEGSGEVPTTWTATIYGDDPGFADAKGLNLVPTSGSALCDAGTAPGNAGDAPIPHPLAAPSASPPPRALLKLGTSMQRPQSGRLDIGAYERGTHAPARNVAEDVREAGQALVAEVSAEAAEEMGAEMDADTDTDSDMDDAAEGFACSAVRGRRVGSGAGVVSALGLASLSARRRRRRARRAGR
ncbi:hypothetical protein [Polyangium aurulentum]|uniref:hypothetical protein n=1 Tax=Polyangium aurulentum TaxID=2567896 RepID=UPI0010AE1FE7|nr:hypothetical protein [Polyangium aurulentum]UQA58876.1 hypothetical protein E8A73_047940 [Polyangium aurulentum]